MNLARIVFCFCLALLIGSGAGGCSEDDPHPEESSPCADLGSTFLQALYDCCSEEEPHATYEDLARQRRSQCEGEHGDPDIAVDEADDAACTETLFAAWSECRDPMFSARFLPEHPCVTRFTGLAGEGSACGSDLECATPLACVAGSCAALPAAGEPCAPTGRCAAEAYCGTDGAAGEICLPRVPPGDACPVFSDSCEAGFFCAELSGTCVPTEEDGAYCGASWECSSGQCAGAEPGQCGPILVCRFEIDY